MVIYPRVFKYWRYMVLSHTYSCTREPLLKGKISMVDLLVLTSFRAGLFHIENIVYLCSKKWYFEEEVNCTEPSISVSVPCMYGLKSLKTESGKKGYYSK
jgi:hypothetical protein